MECPITLCPLRELSVPVAFASAPDRPYELEALCNWLQHSPRNPLTGERADVFDLVLLGDADQRQRGMEILMERGLTICDADVFQDELKEIKNDLMVLDVEMDKANRTIDALVADKTRLERRVNRLHEKYASNKGDLCPICVVS